jgi:DNA-binding NarL/FixJ family response regulator
LIRVGILADTELRARTLARSLADDDRIDVVDVRGLVQGRSAALTVVDVLVVIAVLGDAVPQEGAPVVVLSDEAIEETPFRQGVRAWLPMRTSISEIAAAIVAAASDLTVLTQSQANRWLRVTGQAEDESNILVEKLTKREIQVLRMLADGVGNKEIATALKISDHTAKFHVAQIMAKLGATSRTEAVTIGIRRGLVAI